MLAGGSTTPSQPRAPPADMKYVSKRQAALLLKLRNNVAQARKKKTRETVITNHSHEPSPACSMEKLIGELSEKNCPRKLFTGKKSTYAWWGTAPCWPEGVQPPPSRGHRPLICNTYPSDRRRCFWGCAATSRKPEKAREAIITNHSHEPSPACSMEKSDRRTLGTRSLEKLFTEKKSAYAWWGTAPCWPVGAQPPLGRGHRPLRCNTYRSDRRRCF